MTRFLLTALVLVLAGCEQTINAGNHCGPSTCAGCCQGDRCELGNSISACGNSGDVCEVCLSGNRCTAVRCTPEAAGGGGGSSGLGGGGTGAGGGSSSRRVFVSSANFSGGLK